MAKRTIKITIKLPAGVSASSALTEEATKAAEAAIANRLSDIVEAEAAAKKLAGMGIDISAEELLSRKVPKGSRKPSARKAASPAKTKRNKRTVLSDAQKNKLIEDLKKDIKISAAAQKYDISTATVMNVKRAAGLTKPKGKK